ncbi:MAG: CDP-alcohol phosphatidyltransferase family protein [Desulfobacterota bacterium]|nr:CDP-alcohol phosphatidyltransferase family protein [Thermodesulfobacteriota bacterium]
MLSDKLGHRLDAYLYPPFRKLFGRRGNPHLLTFLGFVSMLVASWLLYLGDWTLAGILIVLSGLFDLLDGAVARNLGKVTPLGAFLDSVMDRYSDLILLLGLTAHYGRKGEEGLVVLTFAVAIGVALIPYVRAKAESLHVSCHVGWMERAERIILLSVGTLFNWMETILWVLAFLTHLTVMHRIFHVWKAFRKAKGS